MRTLLIAIIAVIPAVANAGALVCLFEPTRSRFNIMERDGQDYIQWGGEKFVAVRTSLEGQYLKLEQFADLATFRMVLDINTGIGYGGIMTYENKEVKGDIICSVQ